MDLGLLVKGSGAPSLSAWCYNEATSCFFSTIRIDVRIRVDSGINYRSFVLHESRSRPSNQV